MVVLAVLETVKGGRVSQSGSTTSTRGKSASKQQKFSRAIPKEATHSLLQEEKNFADNLSLIKKKTKRKRCVYMKISLTMCFVFLNLPFPPTQHH